MTIPVGLTLAMDAQFRELSNFITPPKAGKITAIEGNGQVRVDTDDPDGGDVLAWPLNGFEYAVDDVVYVMFAVNNPESAIVVGSKGTALALYGLVGLSIIRNLTASLTSAPVVTIHQDHASDDQAALDVRQDGSGAVLVLRDGTTVVLQVNDGGRLDVYNIIRALTSSGIRLEDDGGNLAIYIEDGGFVGIGNDATNPVVALHVAVANASMLVDALPGGAGSGNASIQLRNDAGNIGAITMARSGLSSTKGNHVNLESDDGIFKGWGNDRNTFRWTFVDSKLGLGVSSPQGSVHAHDGGGHLVVTKTGVNATPQVIIPNGTGDVTRAAHVIFVLSDGTSGVANTATLVQGVTMSFAIAVGGSTWTVTLNANGEVSVARTAGSGTATIKFTIDWI